MNPSRIGDGSAFKSAAHLTAYADIAPATHRSGTSTRGEHLHGQEAINSTITLPVRHT